MACQHFAKKVGGTNIGGTNGYRPRVTQLETEYLRSVTAAELGWVGAVIGDRGTGRLSGSEEELAAAVVDDGEEQQP